MRKLLSVTFMALVVGAWATEHPAEAASYAGGASTRCCPVPQECAGHVEYQLQRQCVLQPVQETVYETQQLPCVREVCETVMQPRCVTTVQTVPEQCVRDVPYWRRNGAEHHNIYRKIIVEVVKGAEHWNTVCND